MLPGVVRQMVLPSPVVRQVFIVWFAVLSLAQAQQPEYLLSGGGRIDIYRVASTGLISIPGSPFASQVSGSNIASDPAGEICVRYLVGENAIASFTFNASTGALAPLPGSPIAAENISTKPCRSCPPLQPPSLPRRLDESQARIFWTKRLGHALPGILTMLDVLYANPTLNTHCIWLRSDSGVRHSHRHRTLFVRYKCSDVSLRHK